MISRALLCVSCAFVAIIFFICWQILIPFLVVTCTFNAIHVAVNVPTQSLVFVVLLMSDFMALVGHCFFISLR